MIRTPLILITLSALLSGCVAAPVLVAGGAGYGTAILLQDRRSQAQISQDEASDSRIRELLGQQGLNSDPNRIRVTTYNGVALLVGQVPNEQARAKAHQAAQSAPGIKNVINELAIAPPLGAGDIASDSFLSTKVRTKLTSIRDFKSHHLTIVVENGSVYLMGLMTEDEQRIAVSVTRDVEGVKRVVKIMEEWGAN